MAESRVQRRPIFSSSGVFELPDTGAIAEYRVWQEPGTSQMLLEIPHTFVPVQHRGQGLAAVVTKEAFNFAKSNGMMVIPTCTCNLMIMIWSRTLLAELTARCQRALSGWISGFKSIVLLP